MSHSPLPPLYNAWIEALLGAPVPRETAADCSACVMLGEEAPARGERADYFFTAGTRCCTYVPKLPNFLVGRILGDRDPELARGRETVEARLQSGVRATPLGLGRPPSFDLLYPKYRAVSFGRSSSLRCPHYVEREEGTCGIWRHRQAVCCSWYCKHDRGALGQAFWRLVRQLLQQVEQDLAHWCVVQAEPGLEALRRLFDRGDPSGVAEADGQDFSGVVDRRTREALFGAWSGRERAFYAACAERVEALGWQEVVAICRPDVATLASLIGEAHQRLLQEQLPERLIPGRFETVALWRDTVRVCTYSMFDALDLPRALLEVLHHFDGRPLGEVLRTLEDDEGIELDEALVRRLVDFELLVRARVP